MKKPCPICRTEILFDSHAPKEVISTFEKIGCTSLQFAHKECRTPLECFNQVHRKGCERAGLPKISQAQVILIKESNLAL